MIKVLSFVRHEMTVGSLPSSKKRGRVGREGKLRSQIRISHTNQTFYHLHESQHNSCSKFVASWLPYVLHSGSMTRENFNTSRSVQQGLIMQRQMATQIPVANSMMPRAKIIAASPISALYESFLGKYGLKLQVALPP